MLRSSVLFVVLTAVFLIACQLGSGPSKAASAVFEPSRDDAIAWTEGQWKQMLSPEEYRILRDKGTETAFAGKYWDEHAHGVYRCAACGLPLFASEHKFVSGTGWPSFTQPGADQRVGTLTDRAFGMTRTEILCDRCGGHLGHVFPDGPEPTGLRYCVNGNALDFEAALAFDDASTAPPEPIAAPAPNGTQAAPAPADGQAQAVFAGGCFWCMEKPFDVVPGVVSTLSGYTGGPEKHPAYKDVANHKTGHYEAIRVLYDPNVVAYDQLLDVFWRNVDPTQSDGQFCDRGEQYRSAIFVNTPEEREAAEQSKRRVSAELDQEIVTPVQDAATFWIAEAYHQDFYQKEPEHYHRYRRGCGRDRRLRELWGG